MKSDRARVVRRRAASRLDFGPLAAREARGVLRGALAHDVLEQEGSGGLSRLSRGLAKSEARIERDDGDRARARLWNAAPPPGIWHFP